jgi:6-phosphogluconolactonase
MPRPVEIAVQVLPTEAEITRAAAELFVREAAAAIALRGQARVAISGGSTPKSAFQLLAAEYADQVAWDKLQLFWVDERCVPPDHPESNYGMTKAALLDKVPLAAENVHRMEGELDPDEAAARYESEIRNSFKLEGAETPTFDLILLGLGPDGHTASLFPHTEGLNEMARICIANHVPQKDAWRMTLTWPVIVQGRRVAFLIEGEEKAEIVETVFTGAYQPETYPAQLIRPAGGQLLLLLDQAAAAKLPKPDADGKLTLEQR